MNALADVLLWVGLALAAGLWLGAMAVWAVAGHLAQANAIKRDVLRLMKAQADLDVVEAEFAEPLDPDDDPDWWKKR